MCYMDDGHDVHDIYEMSPSAFVTKVNRATMQLKRIVDEYRTVDMIAFFTGIEVGIEFVVRGGVVWLNDCPGRCKADLESDEIG
jgi:hypothetical protein